MYVLDTSNELVGTFETAEQAEALAQGLTLGWFQVKELVDPISFEMTEREELGVPMTLAQEFARWSGTQRLAELAAAYARGDDERYQQLRALTWPGDEEAGPARARGCGGPTDA